MAAVGRVVILLLLFALAAAFSTIGVRAIRDRELEWTSRRGAAADPVVLETGRRAHRETGSDAVRLGAGCVALGAVLAAWAGGIVLHMVRLKARVTKWPGVGRSYAWASLALIAVSALCFAPLWKPTSLPLYTTFAVWSAYFYGVSIRRVPKELGGPMFLAAIVAVFATRSYLGDCAYWFCAGTLLSFVLLAHLPVAAPIFWSRLQSALTQAQDG